jgi:hypothetical protein
MNMTDTTRDAKTAQDIKDLEERRRIAMLAADARRWTSCSPSR